MNTAAAKKEPTRKFRGTACFLRVETPRFTLLIYIYPVSTYIYRSTLTVPNINNPRARFNTHTHTQTTKTKHVQCAKSIIARLRQVPTRHAPMPPHHTQPQPPNHATINSQIVTRRAVFTTLESSHSIIQFFFGLTRLKCQMSLSSNMIARDKAHGNQSMRHVLRSIVPVDSSIPLLLKTTMIIISKTKTQGGVGGRHPGTAADGNHRLPTQRSNQNRAKTKTISTTTKLLLLLQCRYEQRATPTPYIPSNSRHRVQPKSSPHTPRRRKNKTKKKRL